MTFWHFACHFMGVDYAAPYGHWVWGNFWSGFAPNLALLGAGGGIYNKHNCNVPRCWRIGRHHVNGTPWCNKHHEAARAKEWDQYARS